MEIEPRNLLLSGACNTQYETFDWSGDFVAFGSNSLVHLYHTITLKTYCAMKGHNGLINCVRFLKTGEILSVCSSGDLIVFKNDFFSKATGDDYVKNEKEWDSWHISSKLTLPKRNILQVAVLEREDHFICTLLSTESDLTLVRGEKETGKLTIIDKLLFGNNLLESSALFEVFGDTYLFISSSDFMIHVYRIEDSLTPNAELNGKSIQFLNSLKGHEDKVTSLAAVSANIDGEDVVLVASGSKDNYIRVWKVTERLTDKVQLEFVKKNIYKLGRHFCHLESILHGHSDAVSSVQWVYTSTGQSKGSRELILVSSSFDFTVQIWQREAQSKVWMNVVRLGQLGGNKNTFFGAKMNPATTQVLACTFTGCFYLWRNQELSLRDWEIFPTITGHSRPITGIDWSNSGGMIVSTSLDQTSRIYTTWENTFSKTKTWHEISRAQVHGHDINAIKFLSIQNRVEPDSNRNIADLLICGADEKILRVLEPPASFINIANKFTGTRLRLYFPSESAEEEYLSDRETVTYKTKTEGGYNVLGLLVKAAKLEKVTYYFKDEEEGVEDMESNFEIPYHYQLPPIEDYLFKNTLWPEVNKLYGHGYEVVCVDAKRDGSLIASCCKSQSSAHSTIFLWSPINYQVVKKLEGHNYTVLQLRFSRSGKYLVSVSRDRQMLVFKDGPTGFVKIFGEVVHAKLIYSVDITEDDKYIVTGSRDHTNKLWRIDNDQVTNVSTQKVSSPLRSIEFAPCKLGEDYVFWTGSEEGTMEVNRLRPTGSIESIKKLAANQNHAGPVNQIRCGRANDGVYTVASCGDDHSLRIYEYDLNGAKLQPAEIGNSGN